MTLGSRFSALLDEREQVSIDLVRVGCGHPVRETRIDFQSGALNKLRGQRSRRDDGHDLIIFAMKDQGWDIELLKVLSEIRFGESLDAVIAGLHSSHHAL